MVCHAAVLALELVPVAVLFMDTTTNGASDRGPCRVNLYNFDTCFFPTFEQNKLFGRLEAMKQ